MKHNILKSLFISVILLAGTSNVWAWDNSWGTGTDHNVFMPGYTAGFNAGESQEVTFNINGTSTTLYTPHDQAGQDRNLSNNPITSQLKITGYKTHMYHKNQSAGQESNGANIKTNELYWDVYHANGTKVSSGNYKGSWIDEGSWINNERKQRWGKSDSSYDLLSNVTASTSEDTKYTIDYWFKATAKWYDYKGTEWGTPDNIWYPGNNQKFKYQFTIPKTTLTLKASVGSP